MSVKERKVLVTHEGEGGKRARQSARERKGGDTGSIEELYWGVVMLTSVGGEKEQNSMSPTKETTRETCN